jgi:cytoskeleton protein RodZ
MSESQYIRSDASSAGGVLAAARREANLSVGEVARHLKLSPAQVEALEDGAYEKLPGRVFVRGFLRNYAKLVGVDPQPLLNSIEREMPEERVVEEPPYSAPAVMPTGERSRWPLYAGIAGTIIAALAAYEFGFNSPPSDREPEAKPVPEAAAPVVADPQPPGASPAAPAQPGTEAPSMSPPSASAGATPAPELASAATAPAAETSKQAGDGRELHFRFDEESWVEVRDRNDKVIFTKLNRAGSEERVRGTPPLKLVVGNARGVRLSYGDQTVDLTPHTGVSVARLTLQ